MSAVGLGERQDLGPSADALLDDIYGKETLRIFISSKMRRGAMRKERGAAADAVESMPGCSSWRWERDAKAGPYSSENECVNYAATSSGFVLILGDDLTPITRKEYRAARRNGLPCYIFCRRRASRSAAVRLFIAREKRHAVYKTFSNVEELKTLVIVSISETSRRAWMRDIARHRARGTS